MDKTTCCLSSSILSTADNDMQPLQYMNALVNALNVDSLTEKEHNLIWHEFMVAVAVVRLLVQNQVETERALFAAGGSEVMLKIPYNSSSSSINTSSSKSLSSSLPSLEWDMEPTGPARPAPISAEELKALEEATIQAHQVAEISLQLRVPMRTKRGRSGKPESLALSLSSSGTNSTLLGRIFKRRKFSSNTSVVSGDKPDVPKGFFKRFFKRNSDAAYDSQSVPTLNDETNIDSDFTNNYDSPHSNSTSEHPQTSVINCASIVVGPSSPSLYSSCSGSRARITCL